MTIGDISGLPKLTERPFSDTGPVTASIDVSGTDQKLDVRSDGTQLYTANAPPLAVCTKNYTYTATGNGTGSGTWRTVMTATTCPDGEAVGLTRTGTWTMPDANTLNWFYEGKDNPGDAVNHVIMKRVS